MTSLGKIFQVIFSSALIAPATLLVVYLVFIFVIRGSIPTAEEIVHTFASLYARFGYEIIFVAALLESLILVNLFVPGMIAMAMGAVFARTGQTELVLVVLTASLGLLIGYAIDFLLGYFGFGAILKKLGYGWFTKQANDQLKRFGHRSLVLGFIYPNVAALLSFTAGTTSFSFMRFMIIAILSVALWMPLWGILIYSLGEVFITILTKYSFLVVTVILASIFLAGFLKEGSKRVRT